MTYPTILGYPEPGGAAVGTNSHDGIMLDTVAGSQVFLKSDGSASDSGIRAVDINTAAQNAEATIATIYGSGSPNQIVSPVCITPNGEIVAIGQPWAGNGTAQIPCST